MIRDREELRQMLLEEREKLRQSLEALPVLARENLGYGNHMADDATEAFDQAAGLALRRNLEQTLRQVEEALDRFEAGTYGICQRCGEPIDLARLEALPHATLCLRCQQRSRYR
ncbi:MAG: TraR/DksA family transcriptional regulator [Anaerolineae bacterium]